MKSKHYQLKWNIFQAVQVVEEYEAKTGSKQGNLPFPVLARIYTGTLFSALQHGKIKNHQKYGVTFFSQIQKQDGSIGIVERGFKIDEPMKLSELINGKSDCYVNKAGIKVKGWRGAKNEWLAMMDDEFHNDECLDAWGVVNCMVKV